MEKEILYKVKGRIHSLQSMGTIDGPGVRFVVFTQGCNLRCGCCHNPDTWDAREGKEYTAEEILARVLRCREYFGKEGVITISGGEPLLQAEFALALFKLCHGEGINTCLDTSGSIMNESVKALLAETDRVLLDVKYTSDELYLNHVGCEMSKPLEFLDYLNTQNIPTTLRQVIIPTLNDSEENALALKALAQNHPCVDKVELLPFKKICQVKYDSMGLDFPFAGLPTPTAELMDRLKRVVG